MLKVVGASWYRTKVSSTIIVSALLLAIGGALFLLNIERPPLENVYCATAYWTPSTGYRVEFWGQGHNLQQTPKGVARVCYKGASSDGDWPHMEIETNPSYSDQVQASSAGILEGSLLWKSIYLQWMETIVTPCASNEDVGKFCGWLRKTVLENYNSVKASSGERLKGHIDSYWYQIHLFYQQLEGLEFGWRYGLKRSPMKRSGLEIPISDFLILNLGADLKLLEDYYNNMVLDEAAPKIQFVDPHQRQTIRLDVAQDSEQRINLSMDHQLHDSVKSPYRVLKKYKLNYRLSPAAKFAKLNAIVPGHDIVLTSASGVISSSDEFYAITGRHSRITVAGIDIRFHPRLYTRMDGWSVFSAARVMAASRLATSSRSWAKLMKRDPFSAKQWILVDRKVLQSYNSYVTATKENELVEAVIEGRQLNLNAPQVEKQSVIDRVVGLIWVVENVPGRLHGEDVTAATMLSEKQLHLQGTPHFAETLEESGLEKETGPEFEYLKESEEKQHSVRFYAHAKGRSDYIEGLTVIHNNGGINENGDHEGIGVENGEDEGPTLSMAGFSSKWTWA